MFKKGVINAMDEKSCETHLFGGIFQGDRQVLKEFFGDRFTAIGDSVYVAGGKNMYQWCLFFASQTPALL